MKKMSAFNWVVFLLIIIGAINWGLIGLFGYNLVASIFGVGTIARIVYTLVGVAGAVNLIKVLKA
jgi:uncharacterized protein